MIIDFLLGDKKDIIYEAIQVIFLLAFIFTLCLRENTKKNKIYSDCIRWIYFLIIDSIFSGVGPFQYLIALEITTFHLKEIKEYLTEVFQIEKED